MNGFLFVLTLIAALGCGLIGGAFFVFSSFVMPALKRLPDAEGIAAMQSINVLAVTPAFMTALFGTAAACLGLGVWSFFAWDGRVGPYLILGAALYLVGTIAVTMVCNVPLNDALANVDPRSPEAADLWQRYLSNWTAWNHARTASALAAATALILALRAG
jgi:uncharacterized membrane protein